MLENVILLYFSKDFDTVDHLQLLTRAQQLLRWATVWPQ